MMFKKVKELLEAGTITQEVADLLDSEISISLKEVRDEASKWRVKYQDLNKSFESVTKSKEDLETKLSSFDEKIKKAKEDGKSELVRELETQRSETETIRANLESIQNENRGLKIQTALSDGLSKYDVIDSELVSSFVKNSIELSEDKISYKDGENILTLDDGLKKFFESKPHLLKPKGDGGSGADGGEKSGSKKSFSEMSLDEKSELYRTDKATYEKLKGSK